MSKDEEFEFRDKYTDLVIQLIVFNAEYDPRRPFSEPIPNAAKGSSFVIDAKRGILLTNSHVVENIISVKGLAPKTNRDIRMRLISLCREKDLAIVQIFKEDWDILIESQKDKNNVSQKGSSKPLAVEFEDTLNLESMTRVVAVGYPLGQDNIKFTPGNISGFETLGNDSSAKNADDSGETVSYIQTTAPTNPGNSGGPLVNIKTGKVVGVVAAGITDAQNVGYAISTRTIWSCLDKLMLPIIHMEEPPLFAQIQSSLIPPGGYDIPSSSKSTEKISKTKTSPTSPVSRKIKTSSTSSVSVASMKIKTSPTSPVFKSFSSETKEITHFPNIIRLPQIGFTYCRISDDLSNYYAEKFNETSDIVKGIYITKVQKDTAFPFLKEGFILSSIIFQSKKNEIIYASIDNSSKVTCTQYIMDKKSSSDLLDIFLKNMDSLNGTVVDRKFTIREIIDIIPLDTSMYCTYIGQDGTCDGEDYPFCSKEDKTFCNGESNTSSKNTLPKKSTSIKNPKCKWGKWNAKFLFKENNQFFAIQNLFLHFEPLDYEIIAGLCLSNLCMNHEPILSEGSKKFLKDPCKFNKYVVVTFTFSDTDVNEIRSITIGDVIKSINDQSINTIDDVKNVLKNNKKVDMLKIITYAGGILVIKSDKARRQDKAIMQAYQVRGHEYIF
jgi:hypothetical protein